MTRLQSLLNPRSIAAIGGKEAAEVIAQAMKMGFAGDIWPVHPGRDEVCGLKAFYSVSNLPSAPDVAYVAVNRQRTIGIVADLANMGAGAVICYASGFGETGALGEDLQSALIDAAGDMPLIGPNCYGLLNYVDRVALWPDQHGGKSLGDDGTGVAIIAQSSNIAINLTMQRRGLPIAYILTVGNQAQTGMCELALDLLDDPRVTALGLHIEGFDSVVGMEAVARKSRMLKKPVVAMKVGRSQAAQKATFTHTASISGQDNAVDAFFRRIGIARVFSLPALLETLKLLHVSGPLDGYSISSLSCSGGEAGLMADAIEGKKLCFRELTDDEINPVQAILGPLVAVSNPLDYHTYIWGKREKIEATFSAMSSAGFDLNCLILDFPREDRCIGDGWQITIDAFEAASLANSAKACVISTLHENLNEECGMELINRGITPLVGVDEALIAIEVAADIGKAWKASLFEPLAICDSSSGQQVDCPDEAEAKSILSEFGITVPNGQRLSPAENAISAANEIGYPVVLKALGLAHKSEQKAVRLNLANASDVADAARDLYCVSNSLYLEKMVAEPVMELLIGIIRDKQFGLLMTIATGGIMVEVFNDAQTLLLPFGRSEIEQALRRLKSTRLFDGFRGQPPADFSAAVNSIMLIQKFALANRHRLQELDINPLIICANGHGAIAADALMVLGRIDHE